MIDHYPKPTRVNGYLNIPAELMEQIVQAQLKALEAYPTDFVSLIYLYHISRGTDKPDNAKNVLATLATFNDNIRSSEVGK